MLPYMQFCAATPLQEAMCTALVEAERPYDGNPSYYDWLRVQYAGKRRRLELSLAAAGIKSLKGEGGFFLIGDVSGIEVCICVVVILACFVGTFLHSSLFIYFSSSIPSKVSSLVTTEFVFFSTRIILLSRLCHRTLGDGLCVGRRGVQYPAAFFYGDT